MTRLPIRISTWLTPFVALANVAIAQFDPPDVATNGVVCFAERVPGNPFSGDVVTMLNTTAAAGVVPGAVIPGASLPSSGSVAANAGTIRWRLYGQLAGNEQIRGRQAPLEAPLTLIDDTATKGRVIIMVPTIVNQAGAPIPLLEILTIGPAGPVVSVLLFDSTAAEPGPYPIVVHKGTNRAYVSMYDFGPPTRPDPVSVHVVDLGSSSPVVAPSILGFYTPPDATNQVAQCAGYMHYDIYTNRLQLMCQNAVHSIEFSNPAAPTAKIVPTPWQTIVGSEIRFLNRCPWARGFFCVRGNLGYSSQAIFYDPATGTIQQTVNFGAIQGSNQFWTLAAGFYTPSLSLRIRPSQTEDVVTIPLIDPTTGFYNGPGRIVQFTGGPLGPSGPFMASTFSAPFGEPEPARNPGGDPVMCMMARGTIDSVQLFGTGSSTNTPLARSGGELQLSPQVGSFSPGVIPGPTALPNGTVDEFVVHGDFPGGGPFGVEIFTVGPGVNGWPFPVSQNVYVTSGGPTTNHTVPYLNGPLGDQPIFLHGFAGAQSAYVRPPVTPVPLFSQLPSPLPPNGGPGIFLPPGGGVLVPPIQRNATTANLGPRRPVFAHDGALLNMVFGDMVDPGTGAVSRVSVQFGSGGAPATYAGGTVIVSEFATF